MGISFGYGLPLFDGIKIERNFGLKVVINSVDPQSLKSFDSAKLDDNTIMTRKQSSRSSSKSAFGAELPSELLCGVSGRCSISTLGTQIDGKDQLIVNPKIRFLGLKDVLETALSQYFKTDYRDNFDWFDNIQVENDPEKCDELCKNLNDDLQNKRYESLSMACPEIFDSSEIEGYTFTPEGDIHLDLYIEEYIDYLKFSKRDNALSIQDLKQHKIWVKNTQGKDLDKWRVFDCVTYETELVGERYVLFKGHWYHISKSYLDPLIKYFKSRLLPIYLPDACKNQREGVYNKKLSENLAYKYICLDMKNIKLKGLDAIEPCDLLSDNGEFLHIKKKSSSSALSHLFSQGKVSGELLITSGDFRKELRKKIRKEGSNKLEDTMIPLDKVKPGDFKVVFGVIDSKIGDDLKLPFFSLVNFQSTSRYLETIGFNVHITKIRER